ncbi:hypothetical protein [Nostoc sp. NMS1]|nr:hypothetical protein [Nostoc sp. NMS1]
MLHLPLLIPHGEPILDFGYFDLPRLRPSATLRTGSAQVAQYKFWILD